MATTESTPQVFTATTVLQTEKVADGEWKVTEIKSDPPVQNEAHSANRKPFQFDLPFGLGVSELSILSCLCLQIYYTPCDILKELHDNLKFLGWRLL